jgi:hypothetical protein
MPSAIAIGNCHRQGIGIIGIIGIIIGIGKACHYRHRHAIGIGMPSSASSSASSSACHRHAIIGISRTQDGRKQHSGAV